MRKILCFLGIHKYKFALVFTKKKFEHCRGVEELNYDKEPHWVEGRKCIVCCKEQYFWIQFISCGYQNVIK